MGNLKKLLESQRGKKQNSNMGKKHLSRWEWGSDTDFLAERLPVTIFYSTVGSPAVEEVAVQSTTATA